VPEPSTDNLEVDTSLESGGGVAVTHVVIVPTSAQPRLCRPLRYADLVAKAVV
jgi:hypothetical protein